jgi:hypothetical protein
MIKQIFWGGLLFFQMIFLHAQVPVSSSATVDILQRLKNYDNHEVTISVYLDPLIETNYYKHILLNQKDPGAMGYQLRIFSASGLRAKEDAEKARSLFLSRFENVGAYLVYDSPDYKVYVGDCRTQSQILELLSRVKMVFPNAFQVYRKISVSYD